MTAPATHLDKIYHVQVGVVADEALVASLTRGVRGDDGAIMRAKHARVVREGKRNSWLEIVLDEGKNRQIRRMLAPLEVEVLRPSSAWPLGRWNWERSQRARPECSPRRKSKALTMR